MANPRRILRLQQLMLETVASFIQRELSDPRLGMISITQVKLASDLSTAAIGWSTIGSEADQRKAERGLAHATAAIQRAVAKSLQTRTTPRIHFRYDDSLHRSQALDEIFEHLRQERAEHAPDEAAETPEAEGAGTESAADET